MSGTLVHPKKCTSCRKLFAPRNREQDCPRCIDKAVTAAIAESKVKRG